MLVVIDTAHAACDDVDSITPAGKVRKVLDTAKNGRSSTEDCWTSPILLLLALSARFSLQSLRDYLLAVMKSGVYQFLVGCFAAIGSFLFG